MSLNGNSACYNWVHYPELFQRTREQTIESRRIKEFTGPIKVTCLACGASTGIESTRCTSCGHNFHNGHYRSRSISDGKLND